MYSECLWKWTEDIKRINQSKSATTEADFRNGMVRRVKLHRGAHFAAKSVKPRPEIRQFFDCGRHLGFLKFIMVGRIKSVELHHRAKFGRNRSNRGQDMAIFRFLKMAAAAILDFRNLKFLTVGRLKSVELHRHAKFGPNRSTAAEIWRFFDFSKRQKYAIGTGTFCAQEWVSE